MRWEVLPDRDGEAWTVEAIDHESDGECYITVFEGPHARERAAEYAALKNGQPAPSMGLGLAQSIELPPVVLTGQDAANMEYLQFMTEGHAPRPAAEVISEALKVLRQSVESPHGTVKDLLGRWAKERNKGG